MLFIVRYSGLLLYTHLQILTFEVRHFKNIGTSLTSSCMCCLFVGVVVLPLLLLSLLLFIVVVVCVD